MPNHAIVKPNQPELVAVYQKKVTLTNAQIKALPTSSFEILPAPGAGKAIQLFFGFISSSFPTLYSNVNLSSVIQFYIDSNQISVISSAMSMFLEGIAPNNAASSFGQQTANLNISTLTSFENKPLTFKIFNDSDGDLLDGENANTLDVTACYSIIDL